MDITDWSPPESPDPHDILHSGVEDKRAGRFATALAKYEWYHAHALKYQPSQYGVRLSFALSYWHDLAKEYEPAMVAFVECRNIAARRASDEKGQTGYQFFHDAMAFNRCLGDHQSTSNLFKQIHEEDPDTAESVYRLAQDSLMKTGHFALCDRYLKAEQELARLLENFQTQRIPNPTDKRDERTNMAIEQIFTREAGNIIAILSVNGHNETRDRLADLLLNEWDDALFRETIGKAKNGAFSYRTNA